MNRSVLIFMICGVLTAVGCGDDPMLHYPVQLRNSAEQAVIKGVVAESYFARETLSPTPGFTAIFVKIQSEGGDAYYIGAIAKSEDNLVPGDKVIVNTVPLFETANPNYHHRRQLVSLAEKTN